MNDSERVAAEWRQAQYDQLVHDMRPSTARWSGGGGSVGGGIGNLGGWVVFFGMIGAIVGGILGRGVAGAIVGAILFGGAMWAVGAFIRPAAGSVSRGAVLNSVLRGVMIGAAIGLVVGIGDPRRMFNAAINYAIVGGIITGVYRLVRRGRA